MNLTDRQISAIIDQMRKWCNDHYEQGADTMVECWSAWDYRQLIVNAPTIKDAWRTLKSIASVYEERQTDARYYRNEA